MVARILLIDDEKMVRWSLRRALEERGYEVEEAGTAEEGIAAMRREPADLVLLDFRLPDQNGDRVLEELRKLAPSTPVLMITAFASIEGAVSAMRLGAYDYVDKPFEIPSILMRIERALEASELKREVDRRREEDRARYGVENIIGTSPQVAELKRLVRRVAESGANTVLVLGESGVGKGLVARALHHESTRAARPFLNITCTVLSEHLLESELFGHERGAFTDAKQRKQGLFELADGGTVFLDEIGDLPPSLQGKLLGFLEERTFRRVGGTQDLSVDVRVIAATNKDLERAVDEGHFREDLYYRLKVIPIPIPPLRDRIEDVRVLADAFLLRFNEDFKKNVAGIDAAAIRKLLSHPWRGNVRELRNAMERAVLLTDHKHLLAEDFPAEIARMENGSAESAPFRLPSAGVTFEELERSLLVQALERTRGNRSQAARLLGMNRDQIRYRIEKFGLHDIGAESAS